MRPFFPFYGSKWNIARHYPEPLPGLPIVEPFAGSAGYATFHDAKHVVLVDADPIIAGVWRYLIEEATPAEILALPEHGGCEGRDEAGRGAGAALPPGPWDRLEWLPCRDGKARPTQPGLFPLAHGVAARVGRLRSYGNAIVPQLAAEFIGAYLDLRLTRGEAA